MGTPLVNPDAFPPFLNRWLNINFISALMRTKTFVTVPAWTAINVPWSWLGYSTIVGAYAYVSPNNFSLKKWQKVVPTNANYVLCVSYVNSDNTVVRYQLGGSGGIFYFNIPAYGGQIIKHNCTFEIWATSPNLPVQAKDLVFQASVLGLVDTRYGVDGELGVVSPICSSQGVGTIAYPNAPDLTGIVAWFDARSGITLVSGQVSAWADRIGGYTVVQGTALNRPNYLNSGGQQVVQCLGTQNLFNGVGLGTQIQEVFVLSNGGIVTSNNNVIVSLQSAITIQSKSTNPFMSLDFNGTGFTPLAQATPKGLTDVITSWAATAHARFRSYSGQSGLLFDDEDVASVAAYSPTPINMAVGDQAGGTGGANIYDIIIYHQTLTEAQRQNTINYLLSKSSFTGVFTLPIVWPSCAQPILNT